MSIGIGLAVNNTKAVFEALFHKPSEFVRTPKYRIEGASDEWSHKKYRQAVAVQPMIEVALGLYFTGDAVLRARQRHLRHRAVPDAVPDRLPLHRHAVAPAAGPRASRWWRSCKVKKRRDQYFQIVSWIGIRDREPGIRAAR